MSYLLIVIDKSGTQSTARPRARKRPTPSLYLLDGLPIIMLVPILLPYTIAVVGLCVMSMHGYHVNLDVIDK